MQPSSDESRQASVGPGAGRFATTHWSLVLNAGHRGSTGSRRCLAALCESYWFPLYAFVRREGYSPPDAQDLTQEFFARLLEKKYLAVADPQRGRFRSFLLATLKHFLGHQRDRAKAQKRGGRRTTVSLDFQSAENRYNLEPAHELTPERLFERRWALALLERVLKGLRDEHAAAGKLDLFERLKEFLTGAGGSQPYQQIADELAMTEGAVKVAVHRLRRRYRELLEEEIAQTVAGPEEIEDERRALLAAVRSGNR
jgi:RNA polymerase sigma factor (sigma-70 family)